MHGLGNHQLLIFRPRKGGGLVGGLLRLGSHRVSDAGDLPDAGTQAIESRWLGVMLERIQESAEGIRGGENQFREANTMGM